jgi:hypothetical protein
LNSQSSLLSKAELNEIRQRCDAATAGPWESFVERRDHLGGNDFIRTGGLDDKSPDIELIGATVEDQDFIAHARQDIPRLLDEVSTLRSRMQELKAL